MRNMDGENKTPEAPAQPAAPVVSKPITSQATTDALAMAQYTATERSGFPTSKVLSNMTMFAQHCVQSGQMPSTINTVAKAVMVFQGGREFGIPPIEALNSFYFVNNHLALYGALVMRRIRDVAKCKIEYGTCDDTQATVKITRKDDGTSLSATVTMDDLIKRGLVGTKDTFKKHPRTMLIYKAVGEIVRHIAPEAVGALSMETDFAESAEIEGRVGKTDTPAAPIHAEATVVPDEAAPESDEDMPDMPPVPTVEEVLKTYNTEELKAVLREHGYDKNKHENPPKNKTEAAQLLVEMLITENEVKLFDKP